jgi:superoxide dismutase, Fe-Mn family
MTITRRDTLTFAASAAVLGAANQAFAQATPAAPAAAPTPPPSTHFMLPALGYAYEALEPHIDTATMNFHHKNHHNAFIGNLNNLVSRWDGLTKLTPEAVVSDLNAVPEGIRTAVRNNMGGHWNHSFFWDLMTPGGAKAPTGDLAAAIIATFGSFEKMQEMLGVAALGRFGSGWAWLVVNKDKKLAITNTPYQDTPHMEGFKPVIGIDVWEHAYYLKHQNRRGEYVKAWWNVVNWDKAGAHFKKAMA